MICHAGDNGKVLVIGGSELFHAASFWAASAASKIVDMVHFSSPAMVNNELMKARAKERFWEGIVVPWEQVTHYIEEDDSLLIGPGMERGEVTKQLIDGCVDTLERHGVKDNEIEIAWVPGAYEIPFAVSRLIKEKDIEGVVTIGTIITPSSISM